MVNLSLNLIKKLYYKEELSTIEIANKLKVTPWRVLKFMKKMGLPRRTFTDANVKRFKKQPVGFSLKHNLSQREKELKIAGIMLYWAEGSNPHGRNWTVDLVNSNPKMVKLFLEFLRIICGIDKKRLRILLYCYSNQNPEELKKYWSKITKVPLAQFIKPYIRNDFLPEKIDRMKYGLVHIRYSDKKLLLQIQKWIAEYLQKRRI